MPKKATTSEAPSSSSNDQSLTRSLDSLNATIKTLPEEYGYAFHPGKNLFFSYLKGIVTGLGVLTAAAIVVPIIIWFLRGIQWVPLVGQFVNEVATQMEEAGRK
jgi:hypothetical protein